MATYMDRILSSAIPLKCYETLSTKGVLDVDCLKMIASKAAGSVIVFASTLVKVPQIAKLYKAKSGEGISLYGVLLELLSMTATTSYSFTKKFPFSAWGDSLFLMIETAAIAYMVLHYSGQKKKAMVFISSYSLLLYLLLSGITPINILWTLQASSLPITVSGKLLQALSNYKNGHTGHLSAITVTLLFLGCVARVFTSIQDTGDVLMIFTFLVASIANFVLVYQVFYYWSTTQRYLSAKTE